MNCRQVCLFMNDITLKCDIDCYPGIDPSWISLTIREANGRIEIIAAQESNSSPTLVEVLDTGCDWRRIMSAIVNLEEGMSGGDCRDSATIERAGETSYQEELYLLAWMDDSDDAAVPLYEIARFMLNFSDEQLSLMHEQIGGFVSDEFVDNVRGIISLQDEFADTGGFPLPNDIKLDMHQPIFAQYEAVVSEWASAQQQEVDEIYENRQKLLKPFDADIERLCMKHREIMAASGGLGGAIGRQMLHGKFRAFLEDYVIANNRIPEGEVQLHSMGKIKFI